MSNRLTKGKARVGSLAVDVGVTATSGVAAQTVTSSSGGVVFTHGSVTATRKIKAISFSGTATSEQNTSFDLPASGILHDVWVKITTASTAAGKISAGLISTTSGDADGFVLLLGTSSTGVFRPGPTVTAATSGDVVTGCTRGILLGSFTTGSTQDEYGYYGERAHVLGSINETRVSVTLNSTSGTAGYLYLDYTEI